MVRWTGLKPLLHTVTDNTSAEFPTMTEEEAAPFGSDLQPFPSDHKYHFEYVLRCMIASSNSFH